MIKVTKISGEEILINPDLIEIVERHGDTVISLMSGNKLIVQEDLGQVSSRVVAFKAGIIKKAQES